MSVRTLTTSVVAALVLAGGWTVAARAGLPQRLRSAHSKPARMAPPSMVAVTAQGKLYHRADCPAIHGPSSLEDGRRAVADGYTPCTRCLPK